MIHSRTIRADHLEASTISQQIVRPPHEFMQASELSNQLRSYCMHMPHYNCQSMCELKLTTIVCINTTMTVSQWVR